LLNELKDNILVDSIGCARLCDFGLATVASLSSAVTSASSALGSYRWMAPELFNVEPDDTKVFPPTEKSDVFAFGRVVIEVMWFTYTVSQSNCSPRFLPGMFRSVVNRILLH
jgi:serine/threonine protein kinase